MPFKANITRIMTHDIVDSLIVLSRRRISFGGSALLPQLTLRVLYYLDAILSSTNEALSIQTSLHCTSLRKIIARVKSSRNL